MTFDAEARALLILDALPGVGLARLRRIVERFGSAGDALAASSRDFEAVAGCGADAGRHDPSVATRIDRALAEARRLDMHVCTWTSSDYPKAMRHLHDPPPVLFLRGRRELLSRPAVTVVGARHATPRARELAERLARALGSAGVPVASGLALGVDGAAHRGALDGGGDTIAVLGRGADRAYPGTHRALFRDIVSRGLVVSEFLPETPPLPHNFPRRNRVLAALSRAVVVVEAGTKSGSLITVDHALDLGVDVWAVPGPIEVPGCAGSNQLLADGARPLVSIEVFVRSLTGSEVVGAAELLRSESEPAGKLLIALGADTLGVDQISARLDMSPAQTLALLTDMELEGLVRQLPGMRFRKAA